MTVYLPKGAKTWYYNFRYRGKRHNQTTHQLRKEDAELVESQVKIRLRQQLAGIAPFDPSDTPTFTKWAGVYVEQQAKYVTRPDVVERTLSAILEFWGDRPRTPKKRRPGTNTRHVDPPYHGLRLGDPIADPSWITQFESWIAARGVKGSTRNSYLSALSGLYKLARQPEYRAVARVPSNPFADVRRSPPNRRVVALEPDQVIAWIRAAPPHVRVALAIAALAPKLRLRTILRLEWNRHIDRGLTAITIHEHKTASRTGLPQVTPIDPQLRAILLELRDKRTTAYVVPPYHGRGVRRPLKDIKKGTRKAAEAIGLTWGVTSGVTFHTIRHSIATLLARLGVSERLRMEIMGHHEIRTTQQYTHLAAADQVAPHAQLSAALSIQDAVLGASHPVSQPGDRKARKGQQNRGSSTARSRQEKRA